MKKDFNEIAKYEKAIKEKYGKEAIANPKSGWSKEKEKAYLESLKHFHENKSREKQKTSKEGFDLIDKTTGDSESRTCPVCGEYSVKAHDNMYMVKFECCFKCYIQYVEGRLDRWKTGWRPKK
jgi:hypothetical protein|tara:strand:- start:1564 stop:1932 length:369 start_codon:yes stop_codon:yes gene_type:complete